MSQTRRLVLVAGPSGSGKSRLSGLTGLPQLRLDDFYHDDTQPDLPRSELGIIDWDHPGSWNHQAAVAALTDVVATGRAQVPIYEISQNRAVGVREFSLDDATVVLCEGIFATELLGPCRAAGLDPLAIWLDRPRLANFVRRLTRDLRERRKTPWVLVRRGVQLMRAERQLAQRAIASGFRPMGMRRAGSEITRLSRQQRAERMRAE